MLPMSTNWGGYDNKKDRGRSLGFFRKLQPRESGPPNGRESARKRSYGVRSIFRTPTEGGDVGYSPALMGKF